mgnify:CR=1 FL=1
MAVELKDTYVVHGAVTTCTKGMRESRLVLGESHGVYLKNAAQVSVKDIKPGENIICFGGCYSLENPATMAAAMKIVKNVKAQTGADFEGRIAETFLQEGGEQTDAVRCVGECMPEIVSVKWDREKEDVSVEQGKNAVMGEATLTCKYGGIIKIETSGQPK